MASGRAGPRRSCPGMELGCLLPSEEVEPGGPGTNYWVPKVPLSVCSQEPRVGAGEALVRPDPVLLGPTI